MKFGFELVDLVGANDILNGDVAIIQRIDSRTLPFSLGENFSNPRERFLGHVHFENTHVPRINRAHDERPKILDQSALHGITVRIGVGDKNRVRRHDRGDYAEPMVSDGFSRVRKAHAERVRPRHMSLGRAARQDETDAFWHLLFAQEGTRNPRKFSSNLGVPGNVFQRTYAASLMRKDDNPRLTTIPAEAEVCTYDDLAAVLRDHFVRRDTDIVVATCDELGNIRRAHE